MGIEGKAIREFVMPFPAEGEKAFVQYWSSGFWVAMEWLVVDFPCLLFDFFYFIGFYISYEALVLLFKNGLL